MGAVNRTARDGFEALRSLDTGSGAASSLGFGDHLFNASDAAFTQARLWQDANQAGVSQASELRTWAELGVVSMGPTPTTTTQDLGNGNTITGRAAVKRSNGSTTQVVGQTRFKTAAELESPLMSYQRSYNHHIPERA
jgi:hypothetical protein